MKLYVDESGNTGETLTRGSNFNFIDKPYYALCGVLIPDSVRIDFEIHIERLKTKHRIQGLELKAKYLYAKKQKFIFDVITYILENKIAYFVELMDKKYYLNVQLIKYFIVPYYATEITNYDLERRKYLASTIGDILNYDVYYNLIKTVKEYSKDALLHFYDYLIKYLHSIGRNDIGQNVLATKQDFLEAIKEDPKLIKDFLPIPDLNPHNRLIHLLPNYNALSNLVGRAQKYLELAGGPNPFVIVNDNQDQFENIYNLVLQEMKKGETDKLYQSTHISELVKFGINEDVHLEFKDSRSDIVIQISDLIAGLSTRFWRDFVNGNKKELDSYLPLITEMDYPYVGFNVGINYVVPISQFHVLSGLIGKR